MLSVLHATSIDGLLPERSTAVSEKRFGDIAEGQENQWRRRNYPLNIVVP